jgi:RNA methyltransferase, TrmH family
VKAAVWTVERVLSLHERRVRDETRCYFVEGVRFVVSAADSGASFCCVVVAPALLRSPFGRMLARRLRARGVPRLDVSTEAFTQLSRVDEPQGIGAVLRQRWEPLARVEPGPHDCWVATGPVRSPGNLGTLMRTCAASGASGVIVPRLQGADPHHPAAVRASMGALHGIRLVRAEPYELEAWKRRSGAVVVGAAPQGSVDYRRVSYRRPVVLVLGSERGGLSEQQLLLCDARVRIPMVSGDSLNLAVAGSVLLYEVWSQRHPLRRRR